MRKVLIPLFVLIVSFGCVQNPKTTKQEQKKEFLLKQYLDKFLSENKNCINNDITKNDCSKTLKNEFISKNFNDSINCLTELPLEFEMLMDYGNNKFVVKFAFSELLSNCKISEEYKVTFQVFSIVDKETASKLKEGNFYNIKGICHDYANSESFTLPSGKYFEGYPAISEMDSKPYFNLGTLIVKNITFSEVPKVE